MLPARISLPNSNHKVVIPKKSNIEMLVGVAFLPPSLPPSRTLVFYIIKRQNCLNIWNRVYILMSDGSWSFELTGKKLLLFYKKEDWSTRKLLYFVNWHNARYLKLVNVEFSKSIFYASNHIYYLKNNFLFVFLR